MTSERDVASLRQEIRRLADAVDRELLDRYALRFPPRERRSPYRRFRMAVGRMLRELGLRRTPPPEPWLPGLQPLEGSDTARAFLVWAVGADRDTLRAACRGFADLAPAFVPVLVTDVADFAFYSRLGWLVEYVPDLPAPATGYAERKRRHLAWRYRELPALPASAGLLPASDIKELLLE